MLWNGNTTVAGYDSKLQQHTGNGSFDSVPNYHKSVVTTNNGVRIPPQQQQEYQQYQLQTLTPQSSNFNTYQEQSPSPQPPKQQLQQSPQILPPPAQIQRLHSGNKQTLTHKDFAQLQQENKLQSLKLKRLNAQKTRLKEELTLDRIRASNASLMVINFTEDTEEPLLPELCPEANTRNKYKRSFINANTRQAEFNHHGGGCCIIA